MAKWEPHTLRFVRLRNTDRRTIGKREGIALGVYHVGRDELTGLRWTVSHIPTGLAFPYDFATKESAIAFVEKARKKVGDVLPESDLVKSRKGIKRIKDAMRAVKAKDGRSVSEVFLVMLKYRSARNL